MNEILDSPVFIEGIYSGIFSISTLLINSIGITWENEIEINKNNIINSLSLLNSS